MIFETQIIITSLRLHLSYVSLRNQLTPAITSEIELATQVHKHETGWLQFVEFGKGWRKRWMDFDDNEAFYL